jgi:Co/Zn/Cd efflux system component
METSAPNAVTEKMRRTVRLAAILNLTYFGVEFAVAMTIGSVSLFADSIDFLEDAAVNFLILLALRWNARYMARMGMVLAGVLLVPGVATLWPAWHKFTVPVPPSPLPLSLAGAGALVVNLSCAIMLARYRQHSGSLTRAAFLSARNDVLANLAIIAAGLVTAFTRSAWPDLVVGLGIALMNADAAREIYQLARRNTARVFHEIFPNRTVTMWLNWGVASHNPLRASAKEDRGML